MENSESVLDFECDFDASKPAVSAGIGGYEAVINKVDVDVFQKRLRLVLNWVLESAHNEENSHSVGVTLQDRIVLWKSTDPGMQPRIHKQTLLRLMAKFGIPTNIMPEGGCKSMADLNPLVEALIGQRSTIWVKHSPKKGDPTTVYENVSYTAPKESAGFEAADTAHDDEVPIPVDVDTTPESPNGKKKSRK